MNYPAKVAFPTPPPTTNALSRHQRSQLLRTTQKLGRLLGTTPALLEETEDMPSQLPLNLQRLAVPLHVQLSSTYTDDDALVRYPSSDTLFSSDYDSPSYLKRSSSASSEKSRRSFDSAKSVQINESWPRPQTERPFLRIAKLDTIPQSPPAHGSYSPPPPYSSHMSYTIPASRTPSTPPHTAPAFAAMPSANSVRRQKMDKLRRTLGDGVPLDLVFRDQPNSSDEDLPARVRASQPPPHRIRSARDSLLLPQPTRAAPSAPAMSPRSAKKLSIIAEREEPYFIQPPSPSERGSVDSERYEGDTEADFVRTHRRSSQVYERRVKRVPVPVA
ncbi:hypothetical protein C8F01DRAFT_1164207 [Mycena amicta]|nr:hypothetical protein C8F01DRAFT_1164207 [Mycena amicta]